MADGEVLEFAGVTKRFGAVTAVDGFSARVEPGLVTGFLGPNGAGKTTSLRILLGLVGATGGSALIGGVPYRQLARPLQSVGAVLEASSFHPGRSAANHLKIYAQAAGIAAARVDEALGLVGLADVAGTKVGGFSLGMRQRLSLAYALLGDPGVLILDEPTNGLDPEGIIWMRGLLREYARRGRTVLISSHLLAEVAQTVDALLIISHGRLVFQGGFDDLVDVNEYVTVVDAPDRAALVEALRSADVSYEILRSGLTVRDADPVRVGAIAAAAGIGLSALQRRGPGLEEVFLDLVNGVRVHPSAGTDAAPAAGPSTAVVAPVPEPEPDPEPEHALEPAPEPELEPEPPDEAIAPEPEGEPDAGAQHPEPSSAASSSGVVTVWDARLHDEDADLHDDDAAESTAGAAPRPAFAVASTGVIDIVQSPDAGREGER